MIEGNQFERRANLALGNVAILARQWKTYPGAAYSTRIKAAVETIHAYLKDVEDLLREDDA